MSEVECEIFSSHSIFKADLEALGSATPQQVIHTLMHSITLEIEACMLPCQTLAAGEGVSRAHMLPLHYKQRRQFLRKHNQKPLYDLV